MIMKNKNIVASLLIAFSMIGGLCLNLEAQAPSRFRGMTATSEVPSDYDDLRVFGANLVAYQIARQDNATDISGTEYDTWIAGKLNAIDLILDACEANGMKIMIQLYSPPGVQNQQVVPARHRLFESNAYDAQFISTWQTIANRYKGRTGIYGYDLLNEPAVGKIAAGVKLWNTLSQSTLSAIRAIDPSVKVLLEPPYGNSEFLSKLDRITDANLAYSIHSYFTSAFRAQGFNGRKINVDYPKPNKKNPTKGFIKENLEKSLAKAVTFQRLRKGTKILVGEFAAPRWAPNGSGARYLRDSIKIFEKRKWDWTNHAWREDSAWSPEHTNDPKNFAVSPVVTDRAKVLKSFFAKNKF
jgi:endoglucanase